MPYMKTEDLTMFYEDIGIGEPIIFIHGSLSRGITSFAAQIQAFQNTNRCIYPDLRGHGETESTNFNWIPSQLADDIIMLMDKLGIEKAHIVGHSMGGDIAMYSAVNHTDRVKSVTLMCSSGLLNEDAGKLLMRYNPDTIDMERYSGFIENMKKEHYAAHKGNWQNFLKQTIKNCMIYPDITNEDLQKITMPMMLIYGSNDTLVNAQDIKILAKNVRNFSSVRIEDTGHFPHILSQKYDEVNELIADFIASVK